MIKPLIYITGSISLASGILSVFSNKLSHMLGYYMLHLVLLSSCMLLLDIPYMPWIFFITGATILSLFYLGFGSCLPLHTHIEYPHISFYQILASISLLYLFLLIIFIVYAFSIHASLSNFIPNLHTMTWQLFQTYLLIIPLLLMLMLICVLLYSSMGRVLKNTNNPIDQTTHKETQ